MRFGSDRDWATESLMVTSIKQGLQWGHRQSDRRRESARSGGSGV